MVQGIISNKCFFDKIFQAIISIVPQLSCIYCRLGAHKRKGDKPGAIVQDFKVIEIIAHEKYNKKTQSNDVALLKLERKANLNR